MSQRPHRNILHCSLHSELVHNATSVIGGDTKVPEVVMEMRIIAKAKEWFSVIQERLWIEIFDKFDLVETTNRGENCLVHWVSKRRHNILSTILKRGTPLSSRWVFFWHEPKDLAHAFKTQILYPWKSPR